MMSFENKIFLTSKQEKEKDKIFEKNKSSHICLLCFHKLNSQENLNNHLVKCITKAYFEEKDIVTCECSFYHLENSSCHLKMNNDLHYEKFIKFFSHHLEFSTVVNTNCIISKKVLDYIYSSKRNYIHIVDGK